MGLEEDIQQRKFKSEYQKAIINVLYTHNHLVYEMNIVFKPHNLTRQQYNVLRILRGQLPNPSSVNLVKERMLDKMSDASRIVERLRVKGLVTRKKCNNDRRAVEVCISEKGLALLEKIDGEFEHLSLYNGSLSEEEAQTLNDLLDKMRA